MRWSVLDVMMPAKVDDVDYINYLIAAPRVFTCTEVARSQPAGSDPGAMPAAHDSFNRLLERSFDDRGSLWREARPLVSLGGGVLVLDDTTLDKPYAKKIELVTRHWSGKHHDVVLGINLITMLWTDGKKLVPCDLRVYDKPMGERGPFGGKDKNEHFRDMLATAKQRGFDPRYVVFDSWYTALDNLKLIRDLGWRWFARMKGNRQVDPGWSGNVSLESIEIPREGRVVHLRGYGMVKVFRVVSTNGDVEHYATDHVEMKEKECEELSNQSWGIEVYHRGLKQCCGVERSQVRKAAKQLGHITLSLRAFLRLELSRLRGTSWYESKLSITRGAVRAYLTNPLITLASSA
jgi:putative transposase